MKVIALIALIVAGAVAVPIKSAEEQQKDLLSVDSNAQPDVETFHKRVKRFLDTPIIQPVAEEAPRVNTHVVFLQPKAIRYTYTPAALTYEIPPVITKNNVEESNGSS